MTIQDAESILEVIRTQSINKAAAALYVSQPALSKCIKRVEQEYGITIFERSKGKTLTLTQAGRCFEEMAQMMLLSHMRFEEKLMSIRMQNDMNVRFATTMQRAQMLSGPIMRYVYENYKDYHVIVGTYPSRELMNALLAGATDIVFMVDRRYEKENVYSTKICEAGAYIYLRNGSDAGNRARAKSRMGFPVLSLREMEGETFICNMSGTSSRYNLDSMLKKNAIHADIIEESSMTMRYAKVDAGYASLIISDEEVQSNVKLDPDRIYAVAQDEQERVERYLVCRRDFRNDIRYRIVCEALKEHFDRLKDMEPMTNLMRREMKKQNT